MGEKGIWAWEESLAAAGNTKQFIQSDMYIEPVASKLSAVTAGVWKPFQRESLFLISQLGGDGKKIREISE